MRKVKSIVTVLAVGLLTVACGSAGDQQQTTTPAAPADGSTSTPTTEPASPGTGTPGAAPDASASARNAGALAAVATAEEAAGGTAYKLDDEDDDNSWEVDVWTGSTGVEVSVSADGSSVLSQRDDDDDDDDGPRSAQANVSLVQAIKTALGEVPGAVDDVELELENGTLAWEVSIDTPDNDDIEVYVSAGDGSVIRVDR